MIASATDRPPVIKNPVIAITGASQGIGAAIAAQFAEHVPGARLALVARNADKLAQVRDHCRALKARAEAFPTDVAEPAQVEAMARDVLALYGRVDVLINNAGVWRGAPAEQLDVTSFNAVIQADLVSVFAVTRAFLPGMIERGCGDIFNMSSTAGLHGFPNNAAYCAAKHGVTGLSKVLRAELRDKGIRVCCVHPGPTASPSWDGTGVGLERLMPTEDVARAFLEIYRLSRNTVVEEIVLRPQLGDV